MRISNSFFRSGLFVSLLVIISIVCWEGVEIMSIWSHLGRVNQTVEAKSVYFEMRGIKVVRIPKLLWFLYDLTQYKYKMIPADWQI